jgi:acyl transferase domain-containing protein
VIPPNIKLTTPNPKIPWEESKLRVPKEPTPWPAERLERASVNSFGIGGANAHVRTKPVSFTKLGMSDTSTLSTGDS